MRRPTVLVVAVLSALALSPGCSGGHAAGAAAGEVAYSGAFANTGASLSGACALLLPAPGSQGPSRLRCASEGGLVVDLTGTAVPNGAGYGTYELSGAAGGLTWNAWVTVANAPGGGLEAGGELSASDDVHHTSGRVELLDERAGVNVAYCGEYVRDSEVDDFALVLGPTGAAGMAADASGASRFLGLATRSGATLTFTTASGLGAPAGTVIATAQIAPGLTSIAGVVTAPPATFSATPCSASVDHVCCGAGAATRCCFRPACPCP